MSYNRLVGVFQETFEIGDPQGSRWEPLLAYVDSGATYTWVPSSLLQRLGVEPQGRWEFETATGEVVEWNVAQTWVRYKDSAHITFVVFADNGAPALLSAYALEGFRLAVDPVNQRLIPVRGLAL